MNARTAFELAATVPWAIDEAWLPRILAIARREGPGPEAVSAEIGRPLANTRQVTMREGVAIVPVVGPIFRHANLFAEVSGAVSVETLARDLTTAVRDPAVKAIVLSLDTPGGEVNGVHELAGMIRDARAKKSIVAYVGGQAASAGYWIASAAGSLVIDATARVGSIGVIAALPNPAAQTAADIEIVSSQSPKKRVDPTTPDGRATIQQTVDALANVFVSDVARNRKVTTERVLGDFGKGGVIVGEAAVKAGMADRLGSLEGVLAELVASTRLRTAPAAPVAIAAPAPVGPLARDWWAMSPGARAALATSDPKRYAALRSVRFEVSPHDRWEELADEQRAALATSDPALARRMKVAAAQRANRGDAGGKGAA